MKSKIKLRIKANVKGNLAVTGFFRRDAKFFEKKFGWFERLKHKKLVVN